MKTIAERVAEWRIETASRYLGIRADHTGWKYHAWDVVLIHAEGRDMRIDFRMAAEDEPDQLVAPRKPTAAEVLFGLRSVTFGIWATDGYEDWCAAGWTGDPGDVAPPRSTYDAHVRKHDQLKAFIGSEERWQQWQAETEYGV